MSSGRIAMRAIAKEWFEDPDLRAEFEALEDKFALASALIEARGISRARERRPERQAATWILLVRDCALWLIFCHTQVDPVRGDLLGRPWYIDETGLKHLAIVCLNCGTIHDCSGSFLPGLLSGFRAAVKVHHDINPMELGVMIMAGTSDPSTNSQAFAINELGIPEEVIDVLVARRLLGCAFAKSGARTNADAPRFR